MKAALRVLTAINEKRDPSQDDIRDLEAFAGPKPADVGLDEFACDAIKKAVEHRAKTRATSRD